MESELAIAQEVQAQLFPRQISQLQTIEVHGVCQPARTVSGDYYDFLDLGSERLGIALGDISGKGISAALMMATVHSAVRAYGWDRLPQLQPLTASATAGPASGTSSSAQQTETLSPAAMLSRLNSQLFRSTPPEKYATLFLASWNGATRRLSYSNAGHTSPIVVSSEGAITRLEKGGMVIGLFDQQSWEAGEVEIQPGDLLVAYTDGITEPENEFGEFGEERLLQLIQENRHLPLERISDAVIGAVRDWIGADEQPDDMTLVLARAR
jgi:sigma-B regulation protein RsbU (phosphoserine phosphatase)